MSNYPQIKTYHDFEDSTWSNEIFPEFKLGLGTYRIYIDLQNIYSITLQLSETEPLEIAEITALRIVPVAAELFALGMAYMGNLVCDYIYGDGAYKNDALIKKFGKRISDQDMDFSMPEQGLYRVKFFVIDINKMGLHCDGPHAREWLVPRADEFLIDDIK